MKAALDAGTLTILDSPHLVLTRPALPSSLSIGGHLGESIKVRACARDSRSRMDRPPRSAAAYLTQVCAGVLPI